MGMTFKSGARVKIKPTVGDAAMFQDRVGIVTGVIGDSLDYPNYLSVTFPIIGSIMCAAFELRLATEEEIRIDNFISAVKGR